MLLLSAPEGTPQNLRKGSTSDTSITIQWEPVICSDRNGKITSYNVTYCPNPDMPECVTETVSDDAFTAVGLLFEKQYEFKVQAFSREHGVGPSASITVTTMPLQGSRYRQLCHTD